MSVFFIVQSVYVCAYPALMLVQTREEEGWDVKTIPVGWGARSCTSQRRPSRCDGRSYKIRIFSPWVRWKWQSQQCPYNASVWEAGLNRRHQHKVYPCLEEGQGSYAKSLYKVPVGKYSQRFPYYTFCYVMLQLYPKIKFIIFSQNSKNNTP